MIFYHKMIFCLFSVYEANKSCPAGKVGQVQDEPSVPLLQPDQARRPGELQRNDQRLHFELQRNDQRSPFSSSMHNQRSAF